MVGAKVRGRHADSLQVDGWVSPCSVIEEPRLQHAVCRHLAALPAYIHWTEQERAARYSRALFYSSRGVVRISAKVVMVCGFCHNWQYLCDILPLPRAVA